MYEQKTGRIEFSPNTTTSEKDLGDRLRAAFVELKRALEENIRLRKRVTALEAAADPHGTRRYQTTNPEVLGQPIPEAAGGGRNIHLAGYTDPLTEKEEAVMEEKYRKFEEGLRNENL
jgi:hypothetical protein